MHEFFFTLVYSRKKYIFLKMCLGVGGSERHARFEKSNVPEVRDFILLLFQISFERFTNNSVLYRKFDNHSQNLEKDM